MSIFTPPPSDLSVTFLDKIFGVGWQSLYNGGHITGSSGAIAAMFHVFNSVVLAGLSLYFIYVFTIGMVGTAHEGTPLGDRYHSIYAPFRAASSTALLAPLPWLKGFCLLQALVLMFIYYGIGAVDHVWDAGVTYLDNHPGQITARNDSNVLPIAKSIFESLVTREYLIKQEGDNPQSNTFKFVQAQKGYNVYKQNASGVNFGTTQRHKTKADQIYVLNFPMAQGLGLKKDALGQIKVSCPKGKMNIRQCQAEEAGVLKMIKTLQPEAAKLVKYHAGKSSSTSTAKSKTKVNAVAKAVAQYEQVIGKFGNYYISQKNRSLKQSLKKFTQTAKKQGWITASEWYWNIAQMEQDIESAVNATPDVQGPDPKQLRPAVSKNYNGYLQSAAYYAYSGGKISQGEKDGLAPDSQGLVGHALDIMATPIRKFVVDKFANDVTQGNPIVAISDIGHGFLDANTAVIAAYVGYRSSAGLVTRIEKSVPGVGEDLSALTNFLSGNGFLKILTPLIWTFLIANIGFGMALAYYVPAIPFILFTMGTIGWLVICIEAVIAAPLWAASHGIPEGEGWAGTYARQGYMLFLTVLLRPTLMIFGFFFAISVLGAVTWFVGKTFQVMFGSIVQGHVLFIFGMLAGIYLMTYVLVAIAHKCFALIHLTPENVFAWIGQFANSLGEDHHRGQVDRNFGGIVSGAMVKTTGDRFSPNKMQPVDYQGESAKTEGDPSQTGEEGNTSGNTPQRRGGIDPARDAGVTTAGAEGTPEDYQSIQDSYGPEGESDGYD